MGIPPWVSIIPFLLVCAIAVGIFGILLLFFRRQDSANLLTTNSKELEPAKPHQRRTSLRFSLRTLLAAVWVIAAVSAQRDLIAVVFVGIPLATIGSLFIVASVSVRARLSFVMAILGTCGICCLFGFYMWPHVICPIKLPSAAHNLYASTEYASDNPNTYVRFQAPVEDCLSTAKLIEVSGSMRFEGLSPEVIDQRAGRLPKYVRMYNQKWWFDPESIENGLYYDGLYYNGSHYASLWIDLDRGIFYMYDDGF